MKTQQFSDEQIVALLQQAEKGEKAVTTLCREQGIPETTFYRWRRQFGGLSVKEVARLRELKRENARLKRLLAERDLEVDALNSALRNNWSPLPSVARQRSS
jgi:putative transposase